MDKKIVDCRIESSAVRNYVIVTMEDKTEMILCSYYPDELSFEPEEFLGLTIYQARDLYHRRDVAYLAN